MGNMCHDGTVSERTDERTNEQPNERRERKTAVHAKAEGHSEQPAERERTSTAIKTAFTVVSILLAIVILAPVILSGQDLYRWANAPQGLGLTPAFAILAPFALDIAAAACIGMVVIGAIWRRERAGVFGILIWVFAGVSAVAQYSHGITERTAGRAQDAWWFFPAIAILGPLLLEATLNRVRKWARQDAGEQQHGAAGFGTRWIPGVAFRETLAAWAASRREGIAGWQDAVAYVRERDALKKLNPVNAVRYAMDALRTNDPYDIRVWLQSRGVFAEQPAIDEANALRTNMASELVANATDEQAANTGEQSNGQTDEHHEARTPVETGTERSLANVRQFVRPATQAANGGGPATDEQVVFVEQHWPGWRTNVPSARDLSNVLGKRSTTPGHNLRKALVARLMCEQETNEDETPTEAVGS